MYSYVFDDETTKKIKNATSKSKDIIEKFGEVENKYNQGEKADIELNLEKIDYVAPTKEEVEKKAKDSLESYKNKGIETINNQYETKSKNIDESIENLNKDKVKLKTNIVNTYQAVKENAENDAIKRGLARSSIIVNKLSNYDNKMLDEISELSTNTKNQINTLKNEKNNLELEKNNALNSFDIEYAVKLQDKIDLINSDIVKAEEAVIKYNNDIAEMQAKWEKENEQENYNRTMSMAEYIGKYGTYALDIVKRNEKYEIAKQHLKELDKDVAIAEIENNSIYKDNLGDNLYNKLLKELKAK